MHLGSLGPILFSLRQASTDCIFRRYNVLVLIKSVINGISNKQVVLFQPVYFFFSSIGKLVIPTSDFKSTIQKGSHFYQLKIRKISNFSRETIFFLLTMTKNFPCCWMYVLRRWLIEKNMMVSYMKKPYKFNPNRNLNYIFNMGFANLKVTSRSKLY